jgi:hypothetical protein
MAKRQFVYLMPLGLRKESDSTELTIAERSVLIN